MYTRTANVSSNISDINAVWEERSRLSSYEKGISAELCARNLLISKGYSIIGQRVKNMYGEIDIIAKKGKDVVAVEVKQRRTLTASKECITYRQKCRISHAFLLFISESKELFENYRIDVVCFDMSGRFEHIENAFFIEEIAA
ncbi:MAG: YraN family protein [Holosporales bacterium]|jgi:putative endonuclease|nr:YraN family protein [Holosporales bacterium]